MTRRIKVLHVLDGGWLGGAQRFVEWFLLLADQKNFSHEVVFLYAGGEIQANLQAAGYTTPVLNWKNGFTLSGRVRLLKFISSCDPDLVQFHDVTPFVKMFVKSFFPSKPLVHFCHGLDDRPWYAEIGQIADDHFTDFVICNSDFTLNTYGRQYRRTRNMHRIYLGLALDTYRLNVWGDLQRKPVRANQLAAEIVYVGRLYDYKGVLDLPPLAVALQNLGMEGFHLHVIGDGPLDRKLRELTASLGVTEKITFWGMQENVLPFLVKANILVFPSWCEEAFGLAPLEGLACGLAIVAYNSGAVPEVLGKAPGAVIVEKKNVLQMALAVMDIVKNKKYPNIRDCAAYLESSFDMKHVVGEVENYYTSICMSKQWNLTKK